MFQRLFATKVAEVTDFIVDGVIGLLLDDPGNADDLAAKIGLLLSDA